MPVTLSAKISALVAGVLALAVLSAGVAVFSSHRLTGLMDHMVAENLSSIKAADELVIAAARTAGPCPYYILSKGDLTWLEEVGREGSTSGAASLLARAGEDFTRLQAAIDQQLPTTS